MKLQAAPVKESPAVTARHEAAHAVVAVRLRLPVVATTIVPSTREVPGVHQGLHGTFRITSSGSNTIDPEEKARKFAALPEPKAVAWVTAYATSIAAGPVGDQIAGCDPNHAGASDDWRHLYGFAWALGIGTPEGATVKREHGGRLETPIAFIQTPAVQAWLKERTQLATHILRFDGGAAWDRVRFALARRKRLTGDEVSALVKGPANG